MMFAFVRGVLSCSPDMKIPDALRKFETEFGIEDFALNSAVRTYYKMLDEYLNQKRIFNDKTKSDERRRENWRVHPKAMGCDGER